MRRLIVLLFVLLACGIEANAQYMTARSIIKVKDIYRQEAEAKAKAKIIDNCIESNIKSLLYLNVEHPVNSYTNLGNDYFFGRNGKEFNIAKAFLCYNLGAKRGEAEAFLHIGLYYETGRHYERFYLEKDIDTALVFYEKADSLNVQEASERIYTIRQNR